MATYKKTYYKKEAKHKINDRIMAQVLRIIDHDGSNIGEMSKIDALMRAKAAGLDLVEIAPQANPPVAKILNYNKFLYEEKKKSAIAKQKSKQTEMKEFKFGPNIGEHDLEVKINRAREFIKDKARVKFTVKFSGRELAHPEVGWDKIRKVISNLADVGQQEAEPKMMNKNISVIILPK